MSNEVTSLGQQEESEVYSGRVKWFNNKAGFGFITVMGSDTKGSHYSEDVFVHHSGVQVDEEQYKYLMQGEYVQFNLRKSDSEKHPYQAGNVRGMWGGKLMCETRNEMPRPTRRRVRKRGSGPRDYDDATQ
tara:strand:- start:146 stop:538 length:393 start_codon:yes stop_codon:yes gene_type:complete